MLLPLFFFALISIAVLKENLEKDTETLHELVEAPLDTVRVRYIPHYPNEKPQFSLTLCDILCTTVFEQGCKERNFFPAPVQCDKLRRGHSEVHAESVRWYRKWTDNRDAETYTTIQACENVG